MFIENWMLSIDGVDALEFGSLQRVRYAIGQLVGEPHYITEVLIFTEADALIDDAPDGFLRLSAEHVKEFLIAQLLGRLLILHVSDFARYFALLPLTGL